MKSYDEMAKSVFKRRDEYRAKKEKQTRIMRSISVSAACLCLITVICVGSRQIVSDNPHGHHDVGYTPEIPGTAETNDPADTDSGVQGPDASTILDTTPGHDVTDLPIEVPGDVTISNVPDYELAITSDFNIPISAASMFEWADLVVIGIYEGTDSVNVNEIMQITSSGTVDVTEVRKGNISADDTICISYYGGVMTVAQIVESVPSERLEKYGWLNMTKEEQEEFTVGYSADGIEADLKAGETYLFFLSESEGGYFVMCDSYGARKVNGEGKAYNRDTRLYEEIPYLTEYGSLDEAKSDPDFGEYLPEFVPAGFAAESLRRYRDGENDYLYGLWTMWYDQITWRISYVDESTYSRLVSADDTDKYDLAMYPIPRAESVPEELREVVDDPVFLAEELTLDVICRRAYTVEDSGDTEGYRMAFSVLVGDTVIEICTKGLTPETVYDMLKGIIE